mmetsp:Transcript_67558/g.106389  ORF Transcript_67558/g.106389 Transcript_67558/m.106389 type:complete len:91 (-) Transcript_67558:70-342(-)
MMVRILVASRAVIRASDMVISGLLFLPRTRFAISVTALAEKVGMEQESMRADFIAGTAGNLGQLDIDASALRLSVNTHTQADSVFVDSLS